MAVSNIDISPLEPSPQDTIGKAPQELAAILCRIEGELHALISSTEEEFLEIGARLHDFQQRAAEITAMATNIIDLVAGDEIDNGINNLEQILERMRFYLENAEKKTDLSTTVLTRILEMLDNVEEPLTGFRKINKVLRMLGISTRIESTRLANGAEGFDNLANDVEELYIQINEKASSVHDRKKELNSTIRQTLERVRSIEVEQRANAGTMLDNAGLSLTVLDNINTKCSEVAASISTASMEVSRNIAEVVMSMQFHDITRQQMEHVCESLGEVCSVLISPDSTSIDQGELKKIIRETGDVCELQTAQLGHSLDELTGAVSNIQDNLLGIAAKEAAISMETKEIAGVADKAGASFFTEMERSLTGVAGVLEHSAAENRNLASALLGVDDTVKEISLFVDSIETIGEEIELIAINAQIKAARTGEEGAALGVLAEAIQRLSLDARRQTLAISGMLRSITDSSGELSGKVDSEASALEAEVVEMVNGLGELLRMLGGVNANLLSILGLLDGAVDSLNSDISGTIDGISVHRSMSRSIGKLMEELVGIVTMTRSLVPASTAAVSTGLKALSGRYTMHSERKIHEKVAAAKDNQDMALLPPPPVEASGEFGENVELF